MSRTLNLPPPAQERGTSTDEGHRSSPRAQRSDKHRTRRVDATGMRRSQHSPLRQIRERQGLTLAELGKRAGLSVAQLSVYERQPPRILFTWTRLADVLGTCMDQLLGREPVSLAPIDTIGRQDRELLDAMQKDADALIGPDIMRLAGLSWRDLARFAFLGTLTRARNAGLGWLNKIPAPKPAPLPPSEEVQEHPAFIHAMKTWTEPKALLSAADERKEGA